MKRIVCSVLLSMFLLSGCVTQKDVDAAYQEGYYTGQKEQLKLSAAQSYSKGVRGEEYEEGYDKGYKDGYNEGYWQALEEYGVDP